MTEENAPQPEAEEEEKPITAGYRPFWGRNGMLTLFYTLFLFPLGKHKDIS